MKGTGEGRGGGGVVEVLYINTLEADGEYFPKL